MHTIIQFTIVSCLKANFPDAPIMCQAPKDTQTVNAWWPGPARSGLTVCRTALARVQLIGFKEEKVQYIPSHFLYSSSIVSAAALVCPHSSGVTVPAWEQRAAVVIVRPPLSLFGSVAPPQYAVKSGENVFVLFFQLSKPEPESDTLALGERRGRKKSALPFWAILSRFPARSLFKQNVSSAIWVTVRSLTFSETSSPLCFLPFFSFLPRLIIKHAQLSQI